MTDIQNSIIENVDNKQNINNTNFIKKELNNIDNRKGFRIRINEDLNQYNEVDSEEERSFREFENNIQVDSMIQRNWNSFHFTRQLKKSFKENSPNTIKTTSSNSNIDHNSKSNQIQINI